MKVLETIMKFKIAIFLTIALLTTAITFFNYKSAPTLPIIAIANYGPHQSLDDSIKGIREELERHGFKDNENIQIQISDVGFDLSLIPQMVTKLKSQNPAVMVVIATPIAQFAKNAVKDIPIVFSIITDPVEAGLLKQANKPEANMTGASDKQDLQGLLRMSKKLMPKATKVGVLYATSEANDTALVKMLNQAAKMYHMEVVAVPIEQARDVPLRMQAFKGKVDFIYVGASGAIQPTLPAIVSQADKMGIPILNVNEKAVLDRQVLGSFGVDYYKVGVNTGQIIGRILKGENVSQIEPIYPTIEAHHGFLSRSRAKKHDLIIPSDLTNITVVE